MKHLKRHIFSTVNLSSILILSITFVAVIVSSFVMESVTAASNSDTPSIGYTIVVDPGHGGLDVK